MLLIAISGISGSGKSTQLDILRKLFEKYNSERIVFINQDTYFLPESELPLVKLSDGTLVNNYETDDAIDNDTMIADIEQLLKNNHIIIEGFALKDKIWITKPHIHIHLQIPLDKVFERRAQRGREVYHNETELIVNEIVLPYYDEVLDETTYDHVIDGTLPKSTITQLIIDIIMNKISIKQC